MSDPYARKTDPAKRHSAALTDGVDRAAARAMLKAIGFDDEALARPLVGIATNWIETMPCNWNQRELARHVRRGIIEAGGTPVEFNTIAVSDGVSMGTEGMRASLVSRETIADSIELVARGHLLDGLVCRRRLRQDDPGCGDGARASRPAGARALQRLDRTGSLPRQDVTIQDVFEAVGAAAAGTMSNARRARARGRCVPGSRRVRRAVHREHDGDGARVPRHQPCRAERRAGDRSREARRCVRSRAHRDAARSRRHAPVTRDHP